MKSKSIFVALSALMVLASCNSGGGTASTDVQPISGSGTNPFIYSVSGTATNCRITPGNCVVSVSFNGATSLTSYTINGVTQQPVVGCNAPQCQFTINGTSATSQQVVLFLTKNSQTIATDAKFFIGGGM